MGLRTPELGILSSWHAGPATLCLLDSAQELGTLWVLSPGSGQGTHRESLFRLGPTRKRGFQKLIFSLAYSPHSCLEVPPLSAQRLTCILEAQGTKIQTLESHAWLHSPSVPSRCLGWLTTVPQSPPCKAETIISVSLGCWKDFMC